MGIAREVRGNHRIFRVAQNPLQLSFSGGLHGGANGLVAGGLLSAEGQIHHRHIGRGHAERHASQAPLQGRQSQGHGLGGSGRGGDDVLHGAAAAAQILAAGAVHGGLGGGGGMDGGHQPFSKTEVVMNHLGDRGQTVGGATGVGHDEIFGRVKAAVVHAHHQGRHAIGILRGCGDDHPLCPSGQVLAGSRMVNENSGGFHHKVHIVVTPGQLLRVATSKTGNQFAVHHQAAFGRFHRALEPAVGGVIFQQVREALGGEQVVNCANFNVGIGDRTAKHQSANASETVNGNLNRGHDQNSPACEVMNQTGLNPQGQPRQLF